MLAADEHVPISRRGIRCGLRPPQGPGLAIPVIHEALRAAHLSFRLRADHRTAAVVFMARLFARGIVAWFAFTGRIAVHALAVAGMIRGLNPVRECAARRAERAVWIHRWVLLQPHGDQHNCEQPALHGYLFRQYRRMPVAAKSVTSDEVDDMAE